MDQEKKKKKYKLCELESVLSEIETVIQNAIQERDVKTDKDNINFLLQTLGKSFVTTREIIILCWVGYPDGALSLSRNLFEQFVHVAYIEGYEGTEKFDSILEKYNDDYQYQRLKNLMWAAKNVYQSNEKVLQYKTKIEDIKAKYHIENRMKDYWWAELNTFSDMCDTVVQQSGEYKLLIQNMYLLYKRACLALHSSCMGNKVRLGSNVSDIDMGPWDRGQEMSLFLASSALCFIVPSVYKAFNENYQKVQHKLEKLSNYYYDLWKTRK